MYPITVNLIPGLPQSPYENGVGAYEGVVAHATASYGDSDEGERNWEAQTWQNAFVHYFVDYDSITQVADTDYKAWGAGGIANPRYVHVELCQVTNDGSAVAYQRFNESYNRWVWLLAKTLADRKLGVKSPTDADQTGTLWGHFQVTKYLGNTTHGDPIDYLDDWGVTWDQVVDDVATQYNTIVNPPAPKPTTTTCHVIANGQKVSDYGVYDSVAGSTIVPVKVVANAFGAEVGWDDNCKKIIVNSSLLESTTVRGGIGYALSREVATALKRSVAWDGSTNTVKFS